MPQPTLTQFLNQCHAYSARVSYACQMQQIILGAAGDPMYGQTVAPGYNWNDLTQDQQFAMIWWNINRNLPGGVEPPEDLAKYANIEELFKANVGPEIYWNWSYAKWEKELGYALRQVS